MAVEVGRPEDDVEEPVEEAPVEVGVLEQTGGVTAVMLKL